MGIRGRGDDADVMGNTWVHTGVGETGASCKIYVKYVEPALLIYLSILFDAASVYSTVYKPVHQASQVK